MSHTAIYRLSPDPTRNGEVGYTDNAWMGAMYIWNFIAERYFNLASFPMIYDDKRQEVWNAWKTHPLEDYEKIVLLSTMDNVYVSAENKIKLLKAMRRFGETHPRSTLTRQASIIDSTELLDGEAIAWQQTSVGEFWGIKGYQETEPYDAIWVDLKTSELPWELFSELT